MQWFLPSYINAHSHFPSEFEFDFGLYFDYLTWHFKWTDIEYTQLYLDINDIDIQLTNGYGLGLLKVDLPVLKEWKVSANQEINSFWFPSESKIELMFKDFDIDFQTELVLDTHGYLDPVVRDCHVKFGGSHFHHENKILAFVMHQVIYYSIIVLENSVYFVGKWIFSKMLGPAMDRWLNHYRLPVFLGSPFRGQNHWSYFDLDFRNTADPIINDGNIEFYMLGELIYADDHACRLAHDPMNFHESETFSQIVLTESLVTCMMDNFFASPIGRLNLNTEKMNQLLSRDDIKFDTSSIAHLLPAFKDFLGADKSLGLTLHFSKPKVYLKKEDNVDIVMEYTMHFSVFHADSDEYKGLNAWNLHNLDKKIQSLLSDEVRMITALNVDVKNDQMYIDIVEHKLNINQRYGQKSQPMHNTMEMSENDYKEFIATLEYTMSYVKKWLNDVHLREPQLFPYRIDEFDTHLQINPGQMHIMLEVEDDAGEFFKDEFE